jgi:hypothetical protein
MNRHNPLEAEPASPMPATAKPQGQKLDGDNLQDVLDAGANAWRVGRQQFFTPPEIARALMLPLPSAIRNPQSAFVDLTMGAGALLAASGASDLFGIDIDSRLARKPKFDGSRHGGQAVESRPTNWHTVCGDLTKFYPLLQEIDWQFDLCGLNPPFSVKWHRKNLVGLVDSECEAVRETFGKSRKAAIDSTLATLLIALDRMTTRGEGYLICTRGFAEKICSTPAFRHVWLWLTIPAGMFGPSVGAWQPIDNAVLYFARSHRTPAGKAPLTLYAPDARAEQIARTLATIGAQRQLLRHGLSIFHEHDFCPLTRQLWEGAKEEWLRLVGSRHGGQAEQSRPTDFNIWLRKDGTIGRHLTPFQTWSGKIPRDKAEALNRLLGQTPMSLVVQRATRNELLEAIGKNGGTPWRVDPMLTAAVEKAVGEYHAQRAPFYPLNEVQRLGYLDEEDMIVCKRDFGATLKKGESYPLSSETIDIEHHEERLNLVGNPEEVTLYGKELAFYIEDSNGDKHSFCGVPPEQQVVKRYKDAVVTAAGGPDAGRKHDLQMLIRHFEIPEVADVAQIDPDRYQKFVDQIREIEKQVNERAA